MWSWWIILSKFIFPPICADYKIWGKYYYIVEVFVLDNEIVLTKLMSRVRHDLKGKKLFGFTVVDQNYDSLVCANFCHG